MYVHEIKEWLAIVGLVTIAIVLVRILYYGYLWVAELLRAIREHQHFDD